MTCSLLGSKRWSALVLAAAVAGCRRSEPPSSQPAPQPSSARDDLNVNGIRYDLPLTGSDMDRATELLKAVRPNGVSWSGKGHTLEVANGRIKLDGKDCGTVKSGDRVKLTADGFLSVNGEKREAGASERTRRKAKEPEKQPTSKAKA